MNTETLLRAGANIIISPFSRQLVKETFEQMRRPSVSAPARLIGMALIPLIGVYELSPFIAAATTLNKNGVNVETAAIFMALLTAKAAVLSLGHAVDRKINERGLRKMLGDELSRPNSVLNSVMDDMGARSYIRTMLDIENPNVDPLWIDDSIPTDKRAEVDRILKAKPWRLLEFKKNSPGYRASVVSESDHSKWAKTRSKELGMSEDDFHNTKESRVRFYNDLARLREIYEEDGNPKKGKSKAD